MNEAKIVIKRNILSLKYFTWLFQNQFILRNNERDIRRK